VVRLHDGTLHDVALVQNNAEYNALMRRLATGPIDRTPSEFDSIWEKLRYLKSRAQRISNKLAGRPANQETTILASMVSELMGATQAWLGQEQALTAAVLSSPDRIKLTDEELGDVFDYLKIQNIMAGPRSLYQLYAASAAYAGYGKGLCLSYLDEYACEREESALPLQRVLHLDLNFESLSGTISTIQTASERPADASFVDPELGLRGPPFEEHGGSSDNYWGAVGDRIRRFVMSFHRVNMPHMTEILLTGPAATDEDFQTVIKAALRDRVDGEDVLAFLGDRNRTLSIQEDWQSLFTFATARGAAEIAKRRQEGPFRCAQSVECKRRREHSRDETDSRFWQQQPGRIL
jgi:hypothetical protein